MKDEYFTPTANLLAFDYVNVVSASFGTTPATPTPNDNNKHCSIPPVKQGGCGKPNKKGKNCSKV